MLGQDVAQQLVALGGGLDLPECLVLHAGLEHALRLVGCEHGLGGELHVNGEPPVVDLLIQIPQLAVAPVTSVVPHRQLALGLTHGDDVGLAILDELCPLLGVRQPCGATGFVLALRHAKQLDQLLAVLHLGLLFGQADDLADALKPTRQ